MATPVHLHGTYGQALANALTAIQHRASTGDASVGGLAGCAFASSATGNLAPEGAWCGCSAAWASTVV